MWRAVEKSGDKWETVWITPRIPRPSGACLVPRRIPALDRRKGKTGDSGQVPLSPGGWAGADARAGQVPVRLDTGPVEGVGGAAGQAPNNAGRCPSGGQAFLLGCFGHDP